MATDTNSALDLGEGAPVTPCESWDGFGRHEAHEARATVSDLVEMPAEDVRKEEWGRGRHGYRFVKRAFDIAFSAVVIMVGFIPAMLLALAIRIESPGNPFYGQVRVGGLGADGKPSYFRMWKFRSMVEDADACLEQLREKNEVKGPMFKIAADPRVTRIGRFIRRHSMASVIIGTPGDGESTKSLPRSANSSLDLQLCERRPGLCCIARPIITYLIFLSSAFFGGQVGVLKRSLRAVDVVSDGRVCAVAQTACAAVPLAEDWTVAA